jgi:predicted neutral ceramidase superfamily lipid hydrolase
MQKSAYVSLASFIIWSIISVIQLWLSVITVEVYWKLTGTLWFIIIASAITGLVYREYTEDAQMKKDGFID